MPVSSPAQREHLLEHGWVRIDDVVPATLCARVVDAIGQFLDIDPDAPQDWYKHPLEGHGIVPLHHHQALWDVRQHPRVHALFSELLGTPRLRVTQDRVSFKAPAAGWAHAPRVDPVHWDAPPHALRASGQLALQGLVYLTDTAPDQGGFAGVPAIYRNLDAWLAAHPPQADGRAPRPTWRPEDLVTVSGPRGAMVIWHRLLPHTSVRNDGQRPRMVQYVAMDPVDAPPAQRSARSQRVQDCLQRRAPDWALRQQVPGQRNPEPGPPLQLTRLGRRLAELDNWPGQ